MELPKDLQGLQTCESEPIRIPGSIQPHGVLFVLSSENLKIVGVSANARVAEEPVEIFLGLPLFTVLGLGNSKLLEQWLASSASRRKEPQRIGALERNGKIFDFIAHRNASEIVVELEEIPEAKEETFSSTHQRINEAIHSIESAASLPALWENSARAAKELSGYDRVMIYKFDETWNGTVLAEAKEESAESFLGLRFPAGDIPAQARALYTENWIRYIPDVSYAPQAIRLENSHRPLDLSFSILRSVSPIHIQYLKNMGVAASMSVSILREGKLWGLITFHHGQSQFLSFEQRQGLEFVGKFLSLQIAAKEKLSDSSLAESLAAKVQTLEQKIKTAPDIFTALLEGDVNITSIASGIGGAALLRGESIRTTGAVPPESLIRELGAWAASNPQTKLLWCTNELQKSFSPAAECTSEASGLMVISIPELTPVYFFLFKPEILTTVTWAGRPSQKEDGSEASRLKSLTPRSSFQAWTEDLHGHSTPWLREELQAAEILRRVVIEADLQWQLELVKRSNEELDQFAWVVSHDLKEPLRGIKNFAKFLREDLAAALDADSAENLNMISTLAERADRFTTELYSYSKLGRLGLAKQEVDLNQVIEEARIWLSQRLQEGAGTIGIVAPLPKLECDRVRIREVFQNLFSNALKYNDSPRKRIEVSWRMIGKVPTFKVEDNGIGVPCGDRTRIFNIFERLHEEEKYGGGTGSGLAIVKRIITLHEGRIWVENSSLGGAAICFTLPHAVLCLPSNAP